MDATDKKEELKKLLSEMDGEEVITVLQENVKKETLKKITPSRHGTLKDWQAVRKALPASEWKQGDPWRPGQSGNPGGRVKEQFSFVKQFRESFPLKASMLAPIAERARELGIDPESVTVGQVYALNLIASSIGGRDSITREIINRMDGKIPDVIKQEISNGIKSGLDNLSDEQLRSLIHDGLNKKLKNDNEKPNDE